jgi:hypothetical protein
MRCGISRQPMPATKAMPAMAHTRPTGEKSNIENGSPSARSRYCAITILGGVPIIVTMPPRIVANESGISDSDTERPAFLAVSMSSVIRITSAATLLMIADSAAPATDITPIWVESERPASTTYCAISSTAPEFINAREAISTRAMMMTASWPKPAKACSAGMAPPATPMISAAKATRS